MISVDTHIHTSFSHGKATVKEMYTAACERGMTVFGFSEHSPRPAGYDYPSDYKEKLTAAFPRYVAEVTDLKKESADVQILLGIEHDWMEAEKPYIQESLARYEYDYIIAGIHFLDNWGFDFSPKDWENKSTSEYYSIYSRYFSTMIAMAQSELFDIIAHPDIIKIFTPQIFHAWVETTDAKAIIRDALTAVKEAGMAMEISSAGLRKMCKEIYPCPFLLEIAADLSLPISFGSDAHSTASVGYAFDKLAKYAQNFGYTESVFFKNRTLHKQTF